jgi:hypothetical protein
MTDVKLYKMTWKAMKLLVLSLPFVAGGVWMITKEPFGTVDYLMGWVITCFFGLGLLTGLFHFFDKRPQIIITEHGIWDRTSNQDEIKWEQIIRAYPINIFGQKFISLKHDDTFVFKKKPYKWAAKINTAVGTQSLNFHISQLNIDDKKMADFINEMARANYHDRQIIIKKYFEALSG